MERARRPGARGARARARAARRRARRRLAAARARGPAARARAVVGRRARADRGRGRRVPRSRSDLLHGQKTGLFLDQRQNRRLAEAARGRAARAGPVLLPGRVGAARRARRRRATCSRWTRSEPALAAARAQRSSATGSAGRVELRRGDAFDVAARSWSASGERFGLVVLDPPALIKSRQPPGRRRARLPRAQPRGDGAARRGRRADHLLVQPPPRRRAVPPGAARGGARRAPAVPRAGLDAARRPDHPQLLAVPETHYLKCAVLQAL